MISNNFIQQLNNTFTIEGRTLIVEFFITFSRFECALKASNFAIGDNEQVKPNWDAFIASVRPVFNKEYTAGLKDAFDYLLQHPPRIQRLHNNQIGWRDRIFQGNEPEINRVSLSIRDIRNNLFHGGKFQGNFEQDVSRNYLLLKNAIIVLDEWLRISDPVRQNYLAPMD